MKNKKPENIEFEESCGNVFADLGLSNPEERLAKAEMAIRIRRLIKEKKLTQETAAELLKISQPKVSLIMNGKLSDFSLEKLFRLLNKLGQSITINIEPTIPAKKRSNLRVTYLPLQENEIQNKGIVSNSVHKTNK